MASVLTFTPQVFVGDVPSCDEVGNATRIRVSAYQRNRTFIARLVRGERRCLVVDFNAVLSASRSIVSGTWWCDQYNAVQMSDATGTDRTASVTIETPLSGYANLKVAVTLDNGEVYNSVMVVRVRGAPWFAGETGPFPTGPSTLSFTV